MKCEYENCDNLLSRTQKRFCSLSCAAKFRNSHIDWNKVWTPEKRLKAALAPKKGAICNPKLFGKRGGMAKKDSANVTLTCEECKKSYTVIKSRSKNRKYCDKSCAALHKFHPNSTKSTKASYKGFEFDSGAEARFAELCDYHGVAWTKNTKSSFVFTDSFNKPRRYYPDFYLPDYDWWVEIKGNRYVRIDDNLRLQAVGDNIELMMSNSIRLPMPCRGMAPRPRLKLGFSA